VVIRFSVSVSSQGQHDLMTFTGSAKGVTYTVCHVTQCRLLLFYNIRHTVELFFLLILCIFILLVCCCGVVVILQLIIILCPQGGCRQNF